MNMLVATKPCPVCNQRSQLTVNEEAYFAWRNGALIQNVMPELSADNREILISGTHPKCWDKLFGEE